MAELIGEITIVHGTAIAEGPDGSRELTQGSPVYEGETITTQGAGSATEITFTDGATLSQGPSSSVRLDDYVFDPDQDTGEMTLQLMEGSFRSVTGKIVDMNPEGFTIDTPLATIGIRGTTTGHRVGGQTEAHLVIDFDGKPVVIQGDAGGPPAIITRDGMGLTATISGLSQPRPATQRELDQFEQLSGESLQDAPPSDGPDEEQAPDDDGGDDGQDTGGEAAGLLPDGSLVPDLMDPLPGQPQGVGPVGPPLLPMPPEGLPVQGGVRGIVPVIPQQIIPDDDEGIGDKVVAGTLDLRDFDSDVTVVMPNSAGYYYPTDVPDDRTDIASNVVNVYGSTNHANTIIGNDDMNVIFGGNESDSIIGGLGNDTIFSSGGVDTLEGENGFDMVSYALEEAYVQIDLGAGTGFKNHSNTTDELLTFEGAYGSDHNDIITGTTGANMLVGGAGWDFIEGKGGQDSLFGGTGNDQFKFTTTLVDSVVVDGGADTDTIELYGSANLELLTTTGVEVIHFNASGYSAVFNASLISDSLNTIQGNAPGVGEIDTLTINSIVDEDYSSLTFNNWDTNDVVQLNGTIGDDTIVCTTVNCTVNGLGGEDTITDTAGDNSIHGDGDNDLIIGGAGTDNFFGDAGEDTLSYRNNTMGVSVNFDSNQVDNDGYGTTDTFDGFEVFEGSSKGDVFFAPMDTAFNIFGSGGNDTLTVSSDGIAAGTLFDGGDGTGDAIDFEGDADVSSALEFMNVEILNLMSQNSSLTLNGSQIDNLPMEIRGSVDSGTSVLAIDLDASQTVLDLSQLTFTNWESGTDVIRVSRLGSDVDEDIVGSTQDDEFQMGSFMTSADSIDGGTGHDNLYALYAGAADELDGIRNIEYLNLNCSGVNASYALSDSIVASGETLTIDATNYSTGDLSLTIDGQESDGKYSITGGEGDDFYYGGLLGDTIHGQGGNDRVEGRAGDDILSGGQGDDLLFGGIGADELHGDLGSDTFYYSSTNEGGDTIADFLLDGVDKVGFEANNFNGIDSGQALGYAEFLDLADKTTALNYAADGDTGMANGQNFVFLHYDSTGGSTEDTWQLWYDHNGADVAGGQTLMASFDADPGLTEGDIVGM
ncbi:MAG: FecR domain-containing protein [Pseudodesulfovibrio sp.]|nr:FecR domain-containing protein [Pseudodesulfovibrio sp.]